VPSRVAIVLAVLAAIALLGAFVQQRSSASPATTTTTQPKPDPNRVITARGPLPGAILIADRGNDRILLIDSHHHLLWNFPTWPDRVRGEHLVFDDDTFVQPGGKALITNEEDHQDILSINIKTHRVTNLFGVPGEQAGTSGAYAGDPATHLNWPDDAYVLKDGTMTVADAYRCRIIFVRHRHIVSQIGQTDVCVHNPPKTLGWVNGDTPMPGGGVLVSEINNGWIDAFSRSGKLLFAFQAPVAYASDPQPLSGGRILLTDYNPGGPGAVLIVNRHGKVLWRYGPTSGWGVLDRPSLAIMLPNGDIAINDDYNDRVVIVDPKKNQIVWQYGHLGQPGTARNYLNTPDGMDYIPLGPHEKLLWQLVHHPQLAG
jgi:outer membrane protein assembly factor BamB